MVDPRDEHIEIVPSEHERWREAFAAERDRVRAVLDARDLVGDVRRIDHVGSTAVPDLPAKDVVDLDVVVADDAVSAVAGAVADALGGDRFENAPEWHPVFRRADGQRFNDHVFAASADGWKVSVATRDALRAHGDLREEYARLKRELAAEGDDLAAYSEGKTEFLGRVLRRAREDDDLAFDFPVPVEP